MKLDTQRQVETPEGLALGLRLAGVFPRAKAMTIDLLVRLLIYLAIGIALSRQGWMGEAWAVLLVFLWEWFYFVFCEVSMGGRTPGKMWVGLRVVHDDGTTVGWSASILRNFLRTIDFLPFGYVTGLVCILLSPSFRRVGDWAAGTVVIFEEKPPRVWGRNSQSPSKSENQPLSGIQACPVPIELSEAERAAVLDFMRRHGKLTRERAVEISDHLHGLTGQTGMDGLRTVLGYGAWLEERA